MLDNNNPFLVYIIYIFYSLFSPGYDTAARIRGYIVHRTIPARMRGQDAILNTAQVSNHQESTTARYIMEEISSVQKEAYRNPPEDHCSRR